MPGKLHNTHAVSRRSNIITCGVCGVKEILEDAVQAGVMSGEEPLAVEDWYVVKKNTEGENTVVRSSVHIGATEEVEDGVVVGYTITLPEKPGTIVNCENSDETMSTGTALMKNISA